MSSIVDPVPRKMSDCALSLTGILCGFMSPITRNAINE